MPQEPKTINVPLFELVNCISDAIDLVNHRIISHHKRVAYIAFTIAKEMQLSSRQLTDVLLAGLLHDIGAVACSSDQNADLLTFDVEKPHLHALAGYCLLLKFDEFAPIAEIVKGHHVPWNYGEGTFFKNKEVPLTSHIIHLADRVDILMDRNGNILDQVESIQKTIANHAEKTFHPNAVKAFQKVSERESFWLDVTSSGIKDLLAKKQNFPIIKANSYELLNMANLISHIIDFRSPFTATHSSGVAASAAVLGQLLEMSPHQIDMLRIAGYLHDLGKLGVPKEILEKPDKLTVEEFNVVKKHAYYTRRILNNVSFLSEVSHWASSHHEHLDGSGYPYHFSGISLDVGSRIIAISDIFTALLEDRPYRSGLKKEKVINILQKCVEDRNCDEEVVSLLLNNFDLINAERIKAQQKATKAYREFWEKASDASMH